MVSIRLASIIVANSFLKPQLAPFFLKMKAKNGKTMEDYVSLTYNAFQRFPFSTLGWKINPQQIKEEIITLAKIVERKKPHVVMEIGTAQGGTLFLWTKAASEDAIIISLDRREGGYRRRIPYYKSFAVKQQQMYLITGNSHDHQILENLKKELHGKSIDFLFIDGDHTYEGVKMDFEMYRSLVREGGMIAFHDICLAPPEIGYEVEEYWTEIKDNYRYEEIIKNKNQGTAGIGILYLK